MSNHAHFVVVPMKDTSLAKTFNTLHMRYSQYFNHKKKISGHLWQGRFYSCILDEIHLYSAIRYVENNLVRAGIAQEPQMYNWSSARAHIDGKIDYILSNDCFIVNEIQNWSSYLSEVQDEAMINNIRKNSATGRPCGDDYFVEKIETFIGKRLKAQAKGRPFK